MGGWINKIETILFIYLLNYLIETKFQKLVINVGRDALKITSRVWTPVELRITADMCSSASLSVSCHALPWLCRNRIPQKLLLKSKRRAESHQESTLLSAQIHMGWLNDFINFKKKKKSLMPLMDQATSADIKNE